MQYYKDPKGDTIVRPMGAGNLKPNINLGTGGCKQAKHSIFIMKNYSYGNNQIVCMVLVESNSTIAHAITEYKLHVKVAHFESWEFVLAILLKKTNEKTLLNSIYHHPPSPHPNTLPNLVSAAQDVAKIDWI